MTIAGPDREPEYKTSVTNGVYRMEVVAPKQLLLHEEFEAMVVDQCLRLAHKENKIPTGVVLVTTEDLDDDGQTQRPLVEGESLMDKMKRYRETGQFARDVAAGWGGEPPKVDLMRIVAEVDLGLDMGD